MNLDEKTSRGKQEQQIESRRKEESEEKLPEREEVEKDEKFCEKGRGRSRTKDTKKVYDNSGLLSTSKTAESKMVKVKKEVVLSRTDDQLNRTSRTS